MQTVKQICNTCNFYSNNKSKKSKKDVVSKNTCLKPGAERFCFETDCEFTCKHWAKIIIENLVDKKT